MIIMIEPEKRSHQHNHQSGIYNNKKRNKKILSAGVSGTKKKYFVHAK